MIELDAVSKRYGAKTIVHGLSFSVAKGEILGFLGPNGAGKTTTIRMIAGYTTASEGRVRVAGYDMATHNLDAARHIGYLPELPPLYSTLDVASYLRFVAKVKGVARRDIPRELDRVTQACRVEAVFRREIFKLSKGYRQRVGLAQALLGDPQVLLLDEPTIGLDPGQLHETREVIRSFGREHAVMLSSHILSEIALICQRIAIIQHGRLLAFDSPAGLEKAVAASNRVHLTALAPEAELRDSLAAVDGVKAIHISPNSPGEPLKAECEIESQDGVEAAIARCVATRWDLLSLERRAPTLENIFLHYVAKAS
jgi:ABC-2 type transport system ATP-binding protein